MKSLPTISLLILISILFYHPKSSATLLGGVDVGNGQTINVILKLRSGLSEVSLLEEVNNARFAIEAGIDPMVLEQIEARECSSDGIKLDSVEISSFYAPNRLTGSFISKRYNADLSVKLRDCLVQSDILNTDK